MKDTAGREIDYIRISITDRCNLRCVYCMPKEGIHTTYHENILDFEEVERLCRVMAELGIKKVKLTGGEPLVRKDIAKLVWKIKQISGIEKVTLTTNGVLLAEQMAGLASAGIDGINISLDTTDPQLFEEITRVNQFGAVMRGIECALCYPEVLLKINCVPLGWSQQDLAAVAMLAKHNNIHVRFIEMMPIGYGKNYQFLSEKEICDALEKKLGKLAKFPKPLGNGPGHYYQAEGFVGKIGFISAMSHQFCSSCNRIRLSAEGYLKTCLQYETGCDLRGLLRSGETDGVIKEQILLAIQKKPLAHSFLADHIESEEQQTMSQIGG